MLLMSPLTPDDVDCEYHFFAEDDFDDGYEEGVIVNSFEFEVAGKTESPKLIPREKLQEVRDEMMAKVMEYARLHLDRIDAVDAVEAHNKAQRALKAEGKDHEPLRDLPPPLPPLLMNTTVGTGKSVLVKALAEFSKLHSIPFTVTAPTHKLCNEHTEANGGMGHYYGRVDAQDDKGMPENACFKIEDTERAGDHNHRVAAALCTRCEHGMAGAIKNGKEGSENVAKAIKWMERRKLDPAKIAPCRFLYEGLPAALAAPILACPSAAFSEAIGWHMDPRSMQKMQRFVVIDEQTELTEEVEIGVPQVNQWINNIDALAERLDKSINFEPDDESQATKELLSLLPEVRVMFADIIVSIVKGSPLDELMVMDLQKKVAKAKGSSGGTARWEQIVRSEDGYQIPLRALNTLAYNIKSGSLRRTKKAIHIYEIKPILRWAIDHGSVIFLDATASVAFKELITAVDGEIFERQVEQNINVLHVAGHLYARGRVPIEGAEAEVGVGDSYRRVARNYIKEIKAIWARLPAGKRAIITHKAYPKYADRERQDAESYIKELYEEIGILLGWFGKHDRGHNKWKFHHLAIVGMPILSSDNIASAYASTRAALAEVGVDWAVWDQIMQDEEMRASNGGVPLPADPRVRAWLIDGYAATLAQAIGRARAVNSDDVLLAELWGGLQSEEMKQALMAHGIEVGGTIENEIHRSRRTVSAEEAIREAVSRLEGADKAISKRSVREALVGLRISVAESEIEKQLYALRASGDIPPPQRGRPKKPQTANG